MDYEVVLGKDARREKNELLDKYDAISHAAVVNIYSLSKEYGRLSLAGFDPDNADHQFFLHTALIVKDILGIQLEIQCGFWKWLKTNWIMRHTELRVRRDKTKQSEGVIWLSDLMEFMAPLVEEIGLPKDFKYGDIYHEYYEKGLKKHVK